MTNPNRVVAHGRSVKFSKELQFDMEILRTEQQQNKNISTSNAQECYALLVLVEQVYLFAIKYTEMQIW